MRVEADGITPSYLTSVPAHTLTPLTNTHHEIVVTVPETAPEERYWWVAAASIVEPVLSVRVVGDTDTHVVVSFHLQQVVMVLDNAADYRGPHHPTSAVLTKCRTRRRRRATKQRDTRSMILAPTTISYSRAILYGYSSAIKGGNRQSIITQSVEFGYLGDVRCRHDCIPSSGAATDHLSPPFPPPHSFTPHTITSLTSAKFYHTVFGFCYNTCI